MPHEDPSPAAVILNFQQYLATLGRARPRAKNRKRVKDPEVLQMFPLSVRGKLRDMRDVRTGEDGPTAA